VLEIWPKGRVADAALVQAVRAELSKPDQRHLAGSAALLSLFVDLDEDDTEEFVVLTMPQSTIFASDASSWRAVGALTMPSQLYVPQQLRQALEANQVQVTEPRWNSLQIGGQQFQQVGQ
jgi:hypothetical protein